MKRSDIGFIIESCLGWRLILFLLAFFSIFLIPKFGNSFPYVDRVLAITKLPFWIWGFGNFDGVHYLRIAQNGYSSDYTQAFFPLYPLIIRFLNFVPKNLSLDTMLFTDPSYFYTAMTITIMFFVIAILFLYKLLSEIHSRKTAMISILFLLSFPTAFYFGAVYPESLFLLLAILTFWFTKKGNFLLAGVMAALASATKIQGILLFIFLIIEFVSRYKSKLNHLNIKVASNLVGVLISPLGLIFYMLFLNKSVGDPLYFMTAQPAFGAGRSSLPLVPLPQVIYRYIKIFATTDPFNMTYFMAVLEFAMTFAFIIILIWTFKKMKFSYWVFSALVVILPTLTGTFSSMPRYLLMAFMVFPYLVEKFKKKVIYIIIVQLLLQIILLSMFIRGYWVA